MTAAVGGSGLHDLSGFQCCGHSHLADGRLGFAAGGRSVAGVIAADCLHHAGCQHASHQRTHGRLPEDSHPKGENAGDPGHDSEQCVVCQFLAMGQQLAAIPQSVDVGDPPPRTRCELTPSIGRDGVPARRVRGPPAVV
ncbi:MAG: hypothetical protein AAF907_01480 [Planctomycetota bacterium]